MKIYLVISLILIFILIMYVLLKKYKSNKDNKTNIDQKFNKVSLNHKSSCFTCEAQLADEYAWSSNPTKCFSCQRELVGRSGNPNLGYIGSTLKYY